MVIRSVDRVPRQGACVRLLIVYGKNTIMMERHERIVRWKGRLRGVLKLAGSERGNAYRLYYTLKCPGYVDVLFAHMKKSKKGIGLPGQEERLIAHRFRARVADCGSDTEETG